MPIEIDLGDGHHAVVKEVDELLSGDQDAVMAAMAVRHDPETGETIVPGDWATKMRKALARRIIVSWTLQHPKPSVRPDSLDKLTLKQKKLLYDGIEPQFKAITEDEASPEDEGSDPTSGAPES